MGTLLRTASVWTMGHVTKRCHGLATRTVHSTSAGLPLLTASCTDMQPGR